MQNAHFKFIVKTVSTDIMKQALALSQIKNYLNSLSKNGPKGGYKIPV